MTCISDITSAMFEDRLDAMIGAALTGDLGLPLSFIDDEGDEGNEDDDENDEGDEDDESDEGDEGDEGDGD
jgi:hypothetical protein